MSNVFLAGNAVSLNIPLVDDDGNKLSVSSINFRVYDQDEVEILPLQPLTTFSTNDDGVSIAIPAEKNMLNAGTTSAIRVVELQCLVSGNIVSRLAFYLIEMADTLMVGVNSFQNFATAQLVASGLPNLTGWHASSERDKISALKDARDHIVRLNFSALTSSSQSHLNDFDSLNLQDINESQFASLPAVFVNALCKAQVAEADSILGGDQVDTRRRQGLLLESIGEVKQMFRSGKPLELPVTRRALGYLSQYVTFSKKIGR